jgi:hypothetical protein
MPESYIESCPEFPWDWDIVSIRISLDFLKMNIHESRLNWESVSANGNIPMSFILETIDTLPWSLAKVCKRDDLTLNDILILRSRTPLANFENMLKYQYVNATEEDIESHPELPWDYSRLTLNKNISEEFIIKHQDKPWTLKTDMGLRAFSLDFILTHKDKFSDLTFKADKITIDDMLAHPEITWLLSEKFTSYDSCDKILTYMEQGKIKVGYTYFVHHSGILTKHLSLDEVIKLRERHNLDWYAVLRHKDLSYDAMMELVKAHNIPGEIIYIWYMTQVIENRCTFEKMIDYLKQFNNFKWYDYYTLPQLPFYQINLDVTPLARRHMAAFKIQRWWLEHYYNPTKSFCRKRLIREFERTASGH